MKVMRRLLRDESGTTAVEYSVMLGFIMLVLIGSVAIFGMGQGGKWLGIKNNLQSHGV